MFFLKQLQGDLHCLKEDIATVERRRQELLRVKAKFAKRGRLATDLSSPNLDTIPRCGMESNGGAISVWRGGQGGAFAPSSKPKPWAGVIKKSMASPMDEKNGATTAKFLENSFLDPHVESAGVLTVSKKRRVLAQVRISIQETALRCVAHSFCSSYLEWFP